jgi:transcriptional regulator with XRE-family HTH domain
MDIGARVKYFREKSGITVNKLANLSGVSQSYLRDIELGNKQPTVEYLEYICNGLKISLKEFFDVSDSDPTLEDAVARLDVNQKKLLLDFLKSL